ncbi:hypothetical protein B0T25DRAFT_563288 [Lasiosphaeria hispida]|uniref:Uncharacterized protein n=1 Tax=Lasiosphaeria hispida TaxID=260671 RepID=A0AAJ0HX92_9PEZI|nr:hypothetical protein B0T25DRAFT_563288 [Lasiosphaeria hispida]
MEQAPPKTDKKEREQAAGKKAVDKATEKAAKFAAKQAKLKQNPAATRSTKPTTAKIAKSAKAAAPALPSYEDKTPPGEKKIL